MLKTLWLHLRLRAVRGDIRYALVFNQVPIINPKFSIDGVLYLGAGFSLNVGG